MGTRFLSFFASPRGRPAPWVNSSTDVEAKVSPSIFWDLMMAHTVSSRSSSPGPFMYSINPSVFNFVKALKSIAEGEEGGELAASWGSDDDDGAREGGLLSDSGDVKLENGDERGGLYGDEIGIGFEGKDEGI